MTGDLSLSAALESLGAQGAAFLAVLLAASAVHKAADWGRSLRVVRGFGGIPGPLAGPALGASVVCELLAGVLLLVPASRAQGAVLAAVVWTGYLALLLRAFLQKRRDVDCGCSFGAAHRPLGAFQITRNVVLVGASAGVAAVSASGSVPALAASQLLGAGALLALYGALDQVMALQPLRAGKTS
jgi:hypothetical protein